tara:strand:- start:462 stop:746 length:285 start_codon:yes stop_codon:yes gene_type:complete
MVLHSLQISQFLRTGVIRGALRAIGISRTATLPGGVRCCPQGLDQSICEQADLFNHWVREINRSEATGFDPVRVINVFQEKDALQIAEQTDCPA